MNVNHSDLSITVEIEGLRIVLYILAVKVREQGLHVDDVERVINVDTLVQSLPVEICRRVLEVASVRWSEVGWLLWPLFNKKTGMAERAK